MCTCVGGDAVEGRFAVGSAVEVDWGAFYGGREYAGGELEAALGETGAATSYGGTVVPRGSGEEGVEVLLDEELARSVAACRGAGGVHWIVGMWVMVGAGSSDAGERGRVVCVDVAADVGYVMGWEAGAIYIKGVGELSGFVIEEGSEGATGVVVSEAERTCMVGC